MKDLNNLVEEYNLNKEMVSYIEENIFPKYDKFYSHGMIHINNVIKNCLMLAREYNLDYNMCFTMAAYHDCGLSVNRDEHEIESGKMFMRDNTIKKFFTDEQIITIKEAIEDHRGSRKERPRNKYGEVLSDSDRDFDIHLLAKRQLATSIKNYPEFKTGEEHFEHCYNYISKRINEKGHFNLWTNNPILLEQRDKFEREFMNKEFARKVYLEDYKLKEETGEKEKIVDYYEDY